MFIYNSKELFKYKYKLKVKVMKGYTWVFGKFEGILIIITLIVVIIVFVIIATIVMPKIYYSSHVYRLELLTYCSVCLMSHCFYYINIY